MISYLDLDKYHSLFQKNPDNLHCFLVVHIYLHQANQLDLLVNFKWKKINKFFLTSVIGVVLLDWATAFFYDRIFPADTEEIIKAVETGNKETRQLLAKIIKNQQNVSAKTFNDLAKGTIFEGMTFEEAVQKYEEMKERFEKLPLSDKELNAEIDRLFKNLEYGKAKELIDKHLQKYNKDAAVLYYKKALIYKAELNYPKAEQLLKTAVALDSTNPEILHEYGSILHTNAQHDKAIEYFNKALAIDVKVFDNEHPNVATSYNNIGSVWRAKGEYDKAIDFYNKALDIFKKFLPLEHPTIKTVRINLKYAIQARDK